MKFLETSPLLSLDQIEEIEYEFNLRFPLEFKNHYLLFNGGYPENDKYTWVTGGVTTINTFMSIKYEGFGNLEDNYKNLIVLEGYLPEKIVPFATDDGGNFFCISSRDEDFGTVYYCNNDHYNSENKEEALTYLDNNYKHFIDNLSTGAGS